MYFFFVKKVNKNKIKTITKITEQIGRMFTNIRNLNMCWFSRIFLECCSWVRHTRWSVFWQACSNFIPFAIQTLRQIVFYCSDQLVFVTCKKREKNNFNNSIFKNIASYFNHPQMLLLPQSITSKPCSVVFPRTIK